MAHGLPLVLVILDGWGYRDNPLHNAIAHAQTPQWDSWWTTRPHLLLEASGQMVGLPEGQMGNSEVGHMHIGAGRVISQDFTRINRAIATGAFFKNQVLMDTIQALSASDRTLHILGLLSQGGVHSHEDHLFAFLALCQTHHFSNVCLHLFLDGRDTPPKSALQSIKQLEDKLSAFPGASIASITGRYYAMDRDKRWQRLEPLYQLLTEGLSSHNFSTAEEAVHAFYQQNITDEFIPPTQIGLLRTIEDGDGIFFFNFRADRARQLTQALILKDFIDFNRTKIPAISRFVSMTLYADFLQTIVAFPPVTLHHTLGEVLAENGLRQLRIAETEKYAHVTFFFNGGSEKVFTNEERLLIPSPHVNTYDLQPEMSAGRLTKTLTEAILSKKYDVIICNYANADMVGHTGNFNATVLAIECLNQALYEIGQTLEQVSGQLLITADHGNAECMFDENTHQAHTAHTNQPVPFLYIGGSWHIAKNHGSLIDIAPTILTLLGIKCPKEMTGTSLLAEDHA
jgi:2,3-bisphosphoglycerate-independent phosphoglycerate mutase